MKNGKIRVALFFKGHDSFRNFIESLETWAKLEVLNVNTFFAIGSRIYGTSGAPGPGPKSRFFLALYGLRFWSCTVVVLELRAVYGTGAVIGTNCYDVRCSGAYAYGIPGME